MLIAPAVSNLFPFGPAVEAFEDFSKTPEGAMVAAWPVAGAGSSQPVLYSAFGNFEAIAGVTGSVLSGGCWRLNRRAPRRPELSPCGASEKSSRSRSILQRAITGRHASWTAQPLAPQCGQFGVITNLPATRQTCLTGHGRDILL